MAAVTSERPEMVRFARHFGGFRDSHPGSFQRIERGRFPTAPAAAHATAFPTPSTRSTFHVFDVLARCYDNVTISAIRSFPISLPAKSRVANTGGLSGSPPPTVWDFRRKQATLTTATICLDKLGLPANLIHFGRVVWSCIQAISTLRGDAITVKFSLWKLMIGVVRPSCHLWVSEWPSANEKPAARLW